MADIRVERKSGGHVWLWVLLAVAVIIAAAILLDRAGYVDLPVNIGSQATETVSERFASAAILQSQEA